MNILRKSILLIITLTFFKVLLSDIAPGHIFIKSLSNNKSCEVQLVSEVVNIRVTRDSSYVECSFALLNHGKADTIEIGFPVMNFHYWEMDGGYYAQKGMDKFNIIVDDDMLSIEDIRAPVEMDSLYQAWMELSVFDTWIKHLGDSINELYGLKVSRRGSYKVTIGSYSEYEKAKDSVDELRSARWGISPKLFQEFNKKIENGQNLWYVWDVIFDTIELKTIKVSYTLPIGIGFENNTTFNYVKYLLNTGSGWKGNIQDAKINLEFENIKIKWVEEISPKGYQIDSKNNKISWELANIEPTTNDDIYIQYYIPSERRKYERYRRKKVRKIEKLKRKGLIN